MNPDERAPEARDALRSETLERLREISEPGRFHREDAMPCYLQPAEARALLIPLSTPDAFLRISRMEERVVAVLSEYRAALLTAQREGAVEPEPWDYAARVVRGLE